jgi:hypothetical protein
MAGTGMAMAKLLLILSFLAPLAVFFTILFRQLFSRKPFFMLSSLCIVTGIISIATYEQTDRALPVLNLLEFLSLLLLFRSLISSAFLKQGINLVMVSSASIILTIFCLKGFNFYSKAITSVECGLLFSLSLVIMYEQVKIRQVFIFSSPEFWIAIGSSVYYFMALFSGLILEFGTDTQQLQHERSILLLFVKLVQFGFYLFAVTVPGTHTSQEKI